MATVVPNKKADNTKPLETFPFSSWWRWADGEKRFVESVCWNTIYWLHDKTSYPMSPQEKVVRAWTQATGIMTTWPLQYTDIVNYNNQYRKMNVTAPLTLQLLDSTVTSITLYLQLQPGIGTP